MLQTMTQTQIEALQLTDESGNTLYNAVTVFNLLREYSARYIIVDNDVNTLLFKWITYNSYKLPDLRRAHAAMYAQYDPLNNYDMTEKSVELHNDGDVTKTRSTDTDHNTVTTSNEYDYTRTSEADGSDKPTTMNYTTTYDNDASGRLAGYTETSGKTTERTTADGTKNKNTVTDDLTVTNAESHDTTTLTYDNTTYTADSISIHELTRSGNIGVTTSQQMAQSSVDLYAQSLIYDYVYDFIRRYTFYAAGGECYADYLIQE